MQDTTLQAQARSTEKKAAQSLRSEDMVPGVLYGQGEPAQPVAIAAKDVERVYMSAGSNRLVEVKIGDEKKPVNTLFVDVQHNPLSGDIIHFDLYKVKMDEEIEAEIPIHLEGEAPATYNLDGVLMQNLETITVRALPNKLPESFSVDLEQLEEINASVYVSDLNIPEGVEVAIEESELIVKIDPPRSEEELEELEEAIDEDAESAVDSDHGTEEDEGDSGASEEADAKEE